MKKNESLSKRKSSFPLCIYINLLIRLHSSWFFLFPLLLFVFIRFSLFFIIIIPSFPRVFHQSYLVYITLRLGNTFPFYQSYRNSFCLITHFPQLCHFFVIASFRFSLSVISLLSLLFFFFLIDCFRCLLIRFSLIRGLNVVLFSSRWINNAERWLRYNKWVLFFHFFASSFFFPYYLFVGLFLHVCLCWSQKKLIYFLHISLKKRALV